MFIKKANIAVNTVVEVLWYIAWYYVSPSAVLPSPAVSEQKPSASQPAVPQSPAKAPAQPIVVEDASRVALFALVIGINQYKYNAPNVLNNLRGAVADADDMVKYLTENLRVHPSQIANLRDENATRHNIKTGIAALSSDKRIREGDAILIYYAGHGTQARAPAEWQSGRPDQKVELIMPHDFNPKPNQDPYAQGIPDVTLAALLTRLAKSKGNNITLIFDCCQSGSISRSGSDRIARGITLPPSYSIMPSVDSEDLSDGGSRTGGPAQGYDKAGMASHVLLAACSSETKSWEIDGFPPRGEFTSALLALLRDPAVRADTITYEDIILQLRDLSGQAPQCFGTNKSRSLFNNKAPDSGRRLLYRVVKLNNDVVLEAGEIQGVTEGAAYDVFNTSDLNAAPVCRLIAKIPGAYSTIVEVLSVNPSGGRPELPSRAWALQTRVGVGADISIAIPTDDRLFDVFRRVVEQMKDRRPEKRNIQLVDSTDPHVLALQIAPDGRAAFNITDAVSVHAGLSRIPHTVSLDGNRVYDVFSGAADFFYHLRHSNTGGQKPFAGYVSLSAYRLETVEFRDPEKSTYDPYDRPIPGADGQPENLNVNGVMSVSVAAYNTLKFDMSDLSISTLYEPTTTKRREIKERIENVRYELVNPHELSDVSIPAHGSLTVGYGAGGGHVAENAKKLRSGCMIHIRHYNPRKLHRVGMSSSGDYRPPV